MVPTILGLEMNRFESNIDYFIEILLGTNCRHLWYLWALFWMFIIVRFCKGRYLGNTIYCLTIAMILSVGCSYWVGTDWFSFRMALHYLPFFFLDEWLVAKGGNSMKMWKSMALVLLSGCVLKLTDSRWMDSLFSLWMNVGIVVVIYLLVRKVSVEKFFPTPSMSLFFGIVLEFIFFMFPSSILWYRIFRTILFMCYFRWWELFLS